MTTVRAFLSEADAALALSRLEAMGITGFLADAISLGVIGAGAPAVPIRLQVSDEDAGRAVRILKGEEGAEPLPDDFVPPEQPESPANNLPGLPRRDIATAFVEGGVCALVILGLPALSALASGGKAAASWGDFALLFIIGGTVGMLVLIYRNRQKDVQEP
ncbi:MAG: DUF2007 domain-containing protein [Verrucomicrobia bacterium]|nr:DUF2007 domain-containing protein [Verrucomicrobiota bacterium]